LVGLAVSVPLRGDLDVVSPGGRPCLESLAGPGRTATRRSGAREPAVSSICLSQHNRRTTIRAGSDPRAMSSLRRPILERRHPIGRSSSPRVASVRCQQQHPVLRAASLGCRVAPAAERSRAASCGTAIAAGRLHEHTLFPFPARYGGVLSVALRCWRSRFRSRPRGASRCAADAASCRPLQPREHGRGAHPERRIDPPGVSRQVRRECPNAPPPPPRPQLTAGPEID